MLSKTAEKLPEMQRLNIATINRSKNTLANRLFFLLLFMLLFLFYFITKPSRGVSVYKKCVIVCCSKFLERTEEKEKKKRNDIFEI